MPNKDPVISIDRFANVLDKFQSINKPIIIGTDQNFDYIKFETQKHTSDLLKTFFSASMIPTITKPTRVTPTSATLIDNIYIKNVHSQIYSGILCEDISDHLPIFCFVGGKPKPKNNRSLNFKCRPMSSSSFQLISADIKDTDWKFLDNLSVQESFDAFYDTLNKIVDTYAPEKNVSIKPKFIIREDWMSKGLLTSSLQCTKLYKQCLGRPSTDPVWAKYTTCRNLFNRLKKNCETILL